MVCSYTAVQCMDKGAMHLAPGDAKRRCSKLQDVTKLVKKAEKIRKLLATHKHNYNQNEVDVEAAKNDLEATDKLLADLGFQLRACPPVVFKTLVFKTLAAWPKTLMVWKPCCITWPKPHCASKAHQTHIVT